MYNTELQISLNNVDGIIFGLLDDFVITRLLGYFLLTQRKKIY